MVSFPYSRELIDLAEESDKTSVGYVTLLPPLWELVVSNSSVTRNMSASSRYSKPTISATFSTAEEMIPRIPQIKFPSLPRRKAMSSE